jgi:hypothetical protein
MNLSPVASQRRASHPVSALQTNEDGLSTMLGRFYGATTALARRWNFFGELALNRRQQWSFAMSESEKRFAHKRDKVRGGELSCRRYSFCNAALIADAYQIISRLWLGDCFESELNA